MKHLTLPLSRAEVQAVAPNIDLHGMVLDANRAGLLIEHLTAVTRWFPQLLPQTLPGITRATIELLGACLAMEAGRADFGVRDVRDVARHRRHRLEPAVQRQSQRRRGLPVRGANHVECPAGRAK